MGSPTLRQDSLHAAVRAAGIDVRPRFHDRIASTNSEATALAEAGAPEWTIVAAGHQTEGRGRLGRRWVEVPGRALLMSVVLRPPMAAEEAPLVSLLAATAMADACRELAGAHVGCKWPNDLVLGERKVGGVLAEARVVDGHLEHVVIGTGVNVGMEAADFPEDLRRTATSLAVEGQVVHPALLVRAYLERLRERYRPAEPRFRKEIVASYRERCTSLRRWVRAVTSSGEPVEGMAVDVDDRGGLVVEVGGGRVAVTFGEVVHLRGAGGEGTS